MFGPMCFDLCTRFSSAGAQGPHIKYHISSPVILIRINVLIPKFLEVCVSRKIKISVLWCMHSIYMNIHEYNTFIYEEHNLRKSHIVCIDAQPQNHRIISRLVKLIYQDLLLSYDKIYHITLKCL